MATMSPDEMATTLPDGNKPPKWQQRCQSWFVLLSATLRHNFFTRLD